MMYAIFFLAALLQSAAYIRLIAVSAGWQPTKKIPLLGAAVLLNAAAQMLFVIPGTMIIPVLLRSGAVMKVSFRCCRIRRFGLRCSCS